MDELLTDTWQKMPYWWGNLDLGYECWGKRYKSGYSKVYIFGRKHKHKEQHEITDYSFCVRHSHSGMFKKDSSPEELMKYLDLRYKLDLLDHGRSLTDKELEKLNGRESKVSNTMD